jgi:hypothetical protein
VRCEAFASDCGSQIGSRGYLQGRDRLSARNEVLQQTLCGTTKIDEFADPR